jgi:hypothetical protein
MQFKEFKVRCSQIGQIVKEPREKKNIISATTQTFIEQWIKEQVYKRQKDFSSKYTEKGIQMENESIEFLSQHLDIGLIFKNEKYFENDYLTGTPDIILNDTIIDVKNSWDCFTFPLLDAEIPNMDYWWQLQGYMALTGKQNAKLVYTLMDSPQRLIDDEIRRQGWKMGFIDIPFEFEQEIYRMMTYADIPNKLKIKVYDIARDEKAIEKIYEQVVKCRDYINQTIKFE